MTNCAGEKVAVLDGGFTSRCAVGNTNDYLTALGGYVNKKLTAFGAPLSISIVIPSFNSGKELREALLSILSQQYKQKVELLVFLNEPPDASSDARKQNDRNEHLLKFLCACQREGKRRQSKAVITKEEKQLCAVLSIQQKYVRLRYVRAVVKNGLSEVYQIILASYVARVRRFCDSQTDDKARKAALIHSYAYKSFLLVVDDDMQFESSFAVQSAYEYALRNNAVVLGRLKIKKVVTENQSLKNVLRGVMQLFLDFKHDRGMNFLTPRGMLLLHALEGGKVEIGKLYSDQLYFAKITGNHAKYFIGAKTTIGESNHPGNGQFLKKLRRYLEGESNDALKIFENILTAYRGSVAQGKYCGGDITLLIAALKARDKMKLLGVSNHLLRRK